MRGRLSPVTLIQLGSTQTVKAPNIADLALEEKLIVELCGLWTDLRKKTFSLHSQKELRQFSILARYGKIMVKSESRDSHP